MESDMGDSIEYCQDCETNVACHLNRGCLRLNSLCPSDGTACSAALWLCNECGHEFEEMDAAGVDVAQDCEEQVIACPKCYANNLDADGSLTHPDDRLPNVPSEQPADTNLNR